jgi:hypothetical protein
LILLVITIVVQWLGIHRALGPAVSWLIGTEQTGLFLGYVRPFAGFSEPSHLAIYLASVYVVLDFLGRSGRRYGFKRLVVATALLLTGSVSGLVMFVVYVAARLTGMLRRMLVGRLSTKKTMRGLALVVLVLGLVAALGPGVFSEEYALRIARTLEDIETGNLVGSEGSRVNAVLALPEYWDSTGWMGFLLGTGYANYQGWLIDNYGHLNESATFSRGGIDNLLVAVFLSTGLVGFVTYMAFLYKAFGRRVLGANLSLVVFVLAVNFSYGYLISSLYWNLLLMLAIAARAHRKRRSKAAVRRRPAMPPVLRRAIET